MLFVVSAVMMTIFIILQKVDGTLTTPNLIIYILLPFVFVGIYWGGDTLLQKLQDRRKKKDYEGIFLEAVGVRMRESKAFLVEDFRHLQSSERFQDAVKLAYFIAQNGESDRVSLDRLDKKFDKRSLEYKAMQYVIPFVREKLAEKSK